MYVMFHKQSIPFALKETFKETKVFPFLYISLMMMSITVLLSILYFVCPLI